ncbi:translocation/assembly module TamB domain-containing protein [Xanthomarina sp. F1114]|uniref:translocation/assembly module TamB domain-containing protein n=1 Tax=Xanthomarina sp. F1114 TaxID=2996019 RepID=UPI00225E67A4|nr:translocation/assembly module TamB [Xanthomarina sp. F1114]MCX7548806.1 translocation/assembly module TamB domain-containing protein [Xanthomarina sp. F1114]
MEETKNKDIEQPVLAKKKRFRFLKIIGRIILGILLLLFLLILFVRSPWGQNIIVTKAVSFLSDKTKTKVEVEKLFITFDGDIQLNGLYLEDTKGDTLIYSKQLEANVPLWALIQGNGIGVDGLEWEGVRANITRKDSIEGFNFQFIIDAFATQDTTTVAVDTTSAPINLILGNLNFKNFDVVYKDAVTGIDSRYKFGKLHANMDKTDLETMTFKASSLELEDSHIKFLQTPVPPTQDSEESTMPLFSVEEFTLTNVFANYQSKADRLATTLDIKELYAEIPNIDIANQLFEVDEFSLKNSSISLKTETEKNVVTEKVDEVSENIEQDIQTFEWPTIQLVIGEIDLENNNFSYSANNEKSKKGTFNANAIELTNIHFQAEDIKLKDKIAQLHLENASLKEFSGINLNNLKFKLNATDKQLKLSNVKAALNNNSLQGNFQLDYLSLAKLISVPDQSKVAVNMPSFKVSLNDLFLFQPDLKENEYLNILSKNRITGNIKATGYLSDINLSKMIINWSDTKISANGNIQNITQIDSLVFNIPAFSAVTKRSDMVQFVKEEELGVSLPEDVELVGNASGNLNNILANATLTTSQGLATIEGNFKNSETLEFNADLAVEDYKLNELLKNEQLGTLNLKLDAQGKGDHINNLDATLNATVSSFKYNNYNVNDLKLIGDIKNGSGTISSNYKDKNLNMNLDAQVVLDSISPEAFVDLDIIGADLQALGLMQRDIKTRMKMAINFKGNSQNFDANLEVEDGVFVYDNKSYLLGKIKAMAHIKPDTTSVSFNNKMLDLVLQSNSDPQTWTASLRHHALRYFYRDETAHDSTFQGVNLKFRGNISEGSILKDVFLVNLKDLDTVNIAVDFNEKERKLTARINAPHINYNDFVVDSLAFSMDTDQEKFNFNLGFNQIKAAPFHIQKTIIEGDQVDNELSLKLLAYHKEEKLIQALSKITGTSEELRFHVLPEGLILNKTSWNVPDSNEVLIYDKKLVFNDFHFSKNEQSIEITDKLPEVSKEHIAIDFKNFKLNEFLSYLNPDESLASGNLNGNFILEEPFRETGIVAKMDISELEVMDVNLGTLDVNAKSLGGDTYDFNAQLSGGEVDLDLIGDYVARETGANIDLDLNIHKFNMSALTGFSQGEITETSGNFSGNFKLNGTTKEPKYSGQILFNNANFKVAMFNSAFTLKDETLSIDNTAITMSNFTIRDEDLNTFVMSGKIGTQSFINPTFDLNINAENFQVLNATKDDNDFLYGKASFNGTAKITGDLQVPKIDMDMKVNSDTDLTYILPSATVNMEARDGIVTFVNRENPDAILTRTKEKTARITGFDIKALLKIGKEAAVTIIIDEETGDNFKVSGAGDFNVTMNPNGVLRLSGVYEVTSGHYELNLYKIVNRKFNLVPGSKVTWSGDPFDAKLDVKAVYEVEASTSSLMAPMYSGSDPAVKGKFREVLPFYVFLNIDGELMEPKISFNLDMPEDEQGAVGGQVYGRIQQLNNQEDELNRQVFSLLVLNRFYPDAGSDGSQGGVASIARDNLNDAVADQLNMFTDKILGNTGFELDFGLNSFTDYQGNSPQQRTQLEVEAQQKLFNDRVIVRVGSEVDIEGSNSNGEETPIIGNVSIEYLLTESGRYRLKGFSKNEFDNVIDGQTVVSGIALIFTQEFNKYSELWDALFKAQTEEEKKIKAEKEAEKEAAKEKQKEKEERTEKSIEKKKS